MISCDPPKSTSPTYTTTVSGKIITPGRAADPTKGSTIATAEVWADPARKIAVNRDGSYRLKVLHSGTFTITADYTGTDGNYKASDPQTIHTSEASHSQNIALNYGRTVQVIGSVSVSTAPGVYIAKNGAVVIVEVEGVPVTKVKTTTIRGDVGSYSFHVAHNGGVVIKTSYTGMRPDFITFRNVKDSTVGRNFTLAP